jgi:hypothetical protein
MIFDFALVLPLNDAGKGIFLHPDVQFAVTEEPSILNSSLATYTHAEKTIPFLYLSETGFGLKD